MSAIKSFSADKLLENAVTSIRLGVQDFKTSQAPKGDPGRALSAVRNLFAGILLLFKYRIVKSAQDDDEGSKLILKPVDTQPKLDADGAVVWEPTKFKSNTIDVNEIETRFKTLDIKTNWKLVKAIQEERNDLEHLYSDSGAGGVAKFLADCFPLLKAFVIDELKEEPAELLGEAWTEMLGHFEFYAAQAAACRESWEGSGLPDGMDYVVDAAACEACGSGLVRLVELMDSSTDWDDEPPEYACDACALQGNAMELLEETLLKLEGGHNPFEFDGDSPTAECPECQHGTYLRSQGKCVWCGYGAKYYECAVCGEGISLEEQELGGLCSYHHHVAHKDD
jgi:hypothetical protein